MAGREPRQVAEPEASFGAAGSRADPRLPQLSYRILSRGGRHGDVAIGTLGPGTWAGGWRAPFAALASALARRPSGAGSAGARRRARPPSPGAAALTKRSASIFRRKESEPESRVSEEEGGREGVLGASPALLGGPAPWDGRCVEPHGTDVKGQVCSQHFGNPFPGQSLFTKTTARKVSFPPN